MLRVEWHLANTSQVGVIVVGILFKLSAHTVMVR